MPRWSLWSGIVSGIVQVLVGGIHSVAGWPVMAGTLREAGVSQEITSGFAMPWHFMGVGMMVLGVATIVAARRGGSFPLLLTVTAVYLTNVLVIALVAGPMPAHLVIALPGILAGAAAYSRR